MIQHVRPGLGCWVSPIETNVTCIGYQLQDLIHLTRE
jgi:hypothetical protein